MTALPLPPLVDVGPTRTTLHHLAEAVLAAEQYAANEELALTSVPDGFATGLFPGSNGETRVSVIGDEVVRETPSGVERSPIDGPFDRDAAAVLYAWWSLGESVLSAVEPQTGESISRVILWPEHFDIAVTIETGDQQGINVGFSPGDEFSAMPYVYVGPWQVPTGPFWNASFGAFRTYEQVFADPPRLAAAFIAEARATLTRD